MYKAEYQNRFRNLNYVNFQAPKYRQQLERVIVAILNRIIQQKVPATVLENVVVVGRRVMKVTFLWILRISFLICTYELSVFPHRTRQNSGLPEVGRSLYWRLLVGKDRKEMLYIAYKEYKHLQCGIIMIGGSLRIKNRPTKKIKDTLNDDR